ncbi:MAG: ABC transporter permease [Candidatus Saccharibacteria bacterium]
MFAALKSEFRKLYTIRSTYILTFVSILLAAVFAFYVEGIKGHDGVIQPNTLQNAMLTAGAFLPIFGGAIVATLLATHEYRYTTIMYTLTSLNRRGKVLVAKIIALTGHVLILTVLGVAIAVGSMYLGLTVKHLNLIPQQVAWFSVIWRSLFYVWAYSMAGLLLGLLTRQVVGAIVVILLLPGTIEQLIGLMLKENAKYLPFTDLTRVVDTNPITSPSYAGSAGLFCAYLAITVVITWVLFLRRDAN